MLRDVLLQYRPAIALRQVLRGVVGIDRHVVETVLRNQGFGEGLTDRSLGALLMLMQVAGLATYAKRTGVITVAPDSGDEATPPSVFVSPAMPYSNKAGLRRVLGDQRGSIAWFDKHFMPAALDALADVADGNLINRIRILSLRLEGNSGKEARRRFSDLCDELRGRGVQVDWNEIDSSIVRDSHDRWIIGDTEAWNVPNVNAISLSAKVR